MSVVRCTGGNVVVDALGIFALGVAGAVIGGVISGAVEHWLASPGPDPPARWRRGPAWLLERARRERAAAELADGQGEVQTPPAGPGARS